MTTKRYPGWKTQVKIATTEGGLATAPVITNIRNVKIDVDPNITREGKGMGQGRNKDVEENLIDCTGSIERKADNVPVVASPGTTTFEQLVEKYQTEDMTGLWMTLKDLVTGDTDKISGMKGKYGESRSMEGNKMETYDFSFEAITKVA